MGTIVKHCKENKIPNSAGLVSKWSRGINIKETGNMEKDAAYVMNKSRMSFCLRDKPNGTVLEELDLLTYVAIHELAHVMSNELGHGAEFKKNFYSLLQIGSEIKYLNPETKQMEFVYNSNTLSNYSQFCGVSLK